MKFNLISINLTLHSSDLFLNLYQLYYYPYSLYNYYKILL
jgi:hypothetical protein